MIKPETLTPPKQNMTLERLKSLYELIGRMNSVYDLTELLEFVVERALSLTGGRRGLLLLSDDYERKLQEIAVAKGEELGKQDLEQALTFVSTTVIKDVLDCGEPRLIADLQTDQRYEGAASEATLTFKKVRSVLAVPLKVEAQLVGLIYIDHFRQGIFGQGDLEFLSAFASQAALAIHRAQQHQRQVNELTLLNELSRSVVQVLDLEEVLTRIVNEAIRMLNVETGSVLLLDEAASELFFATSVSAGRRLEISTRLRRDQGVAGWVVTHQEPACIGEVAQDPRWFGEVETSFATRSLLCVPLQIDGRVLGVLQALNKKSPDGFDRGDIARLSAFAASATIAIENARLFQEVRQARHLRALNELALSLSSTLDLDTILNLGLEKSLLMLGAEAGMISLRLEQQASASFIHVSRGLSGQPALPQLEQQILDKLSALILQGGMDKVLLLDKTHPQNFAGEVDLAAASIKALAFAPITIGHKVNGALTIMRTTSASFSEEEINLLVSITHIIGLASQNAIHYNQVGTQAMHLTYLNEVGSALTRSLDLAHVLKVIIAGVNTLLETERTSVFLIDTETDELVLRYSTDGEANIRLPAPWQGIAGWVATHDQPALVNDTMTDPRHLRQLAIEIGYEAHSILCVPLKVEGQVIGVLEVLNKTDGQQFNYYHQALLTELTKWAAIALHNARLFDERGQAYQRLAAEQQRRVAAETRGAMAAIILDMAHTMNNVIGAIRVWATRLEKAAQTNPQVTLAKFNNELRRMRENTEEAIRLISTMTDPLEEAVLAPTDVHDCLARAIQSCWWPENVFLERDYGRDVPLVRANAKRLEAVFHNLLSNAIQILSRPGGTIRLTTRRASPGQVEIVVADDGPGIPPELQDRVFNPGVSGKEGGLGLGLWLVETFVHQFDGQIEFTTSPEKGTAFTITLQPVNNLMSLS
ncbi:MAG: GAF domain-containing protein [Anaerolineales bacterium]|nr:GAF domain-containing protein [Anaerolineales bacterium]